MRHQGPTVRGMELKDTEVPVGVSVWRDSSGGRIVAAVYVWDGGFEWCHSVPPSNGHPTSLSELGALQGREYFPLADDEKTIIVGPLEFARGFLRSVLMTGLDDCKAITSYSWPDGLTTTQVAWPPIDLDGRSDLVAEA